MKSFDIDKYNSRECQVHNHGFYLGQQSKQAEVDELRKRIDETMKMLAHGEGYGYEQCTRLAINILKGNKNDH